LVRFGAGAFFFAAGFFTAGFFTAGFFGAGFFAADFFAADFFAADFFRAGFSALVLLATGFRAVDFFVVGFFLTTLLVLAPAILEIYAAERVKKAGLTVRLVPARRTINSKVSGRGVVDEVILSNVPCAVPGKTHPIRRTPPAERKNSMPTRR
jgi:hypothetical protein